MRAFTALLLLISCAPSVNPAARADVDAKLAAIQQQQRTFASPAVPQRMTLAVRGAAELEPLDQLRPRAALAFHRGGVCQTEPKGG